MKINLKFMIIALCLSQIVGCSNVRNAMVQDGPPTRKVEVYKIPNAVPKIEPRSRYGNSTSYVVNGKRYHVLRSAKDYNKKGIASWYGTKFHGQLTSNREPYNMFAMTAASTDLPLPTYVRVTDLENGRQVIVKVNDRGPFDKARIIDLSYAAAKKLGYADKGTALVQVTAIGLKDKPKLYLQVGAFKNINAAKKLCSDIKIMRKLPARINIGYYHHASIYRVQIGPLASAAENDYLQKFLQDKGFGRGIPVVD